MRPTLTYVKEKFEYYNKLCFDGKLTMPPIRLNLRKRFLGFVNILDLHMEISVHDDLPEEEYIDTIVHEMIHYYILSNNIEDDGVHGTEFRRIMNDITNKYGIKITINYEPTEKELVEKQDRRVRYIAVVEYLNQTFGFAVVAKNKIGQICLSASKDEFVEKVSLYMSDRAIWGSFPVRITPQFIIIDEDKLKFYLTGAKDVTSSLNIE